MSFLTIRGQQRHLPLRFEIRNIYPKPENAVDQERSFQFASDLKCLKVFDFNSTLGTYNFSSLLMLDHFLKGELRRMNIDLFMVAAYFIIIFLIGVYKSAVQKKDAESYFLSSRKLRWPSIAMSTIATNIQAGHFIGMGGAAYAYGLAQANFEIGAVFGILLAAFFFVPLSLRLKVR